MNVNKTIQQNKTGADFKRIIETRHNLNQPHEPRLKRYYEIQKAITSATFTLRVPLFNPTPDDFAQVHKTIAHTLNYDVKEFMAYQERLTDRRNKYRKINSSYSRHDYINGVLENTKQHGQELAKVISNANRPPEEVEQDRRMIDYTLRACEYIKRIDKTNSPMRDRLEPNLAHIAKQFNEGDWCLIDWYALGMSSDTASNLYYLHHLHRVHVSLKNPLQIAHYPTLRHLRDKREVVTKLGKYLTTFKDFIGLSESDVKNYVEKYQAIIASRTGWQINYIESNDADGFVRIYRDCRAGSCMKGEDAVKVYAHDKSVLRLAYMQNVEGEIIARCIVREDRKQYIRTYPEANGTTEGRYLQDFLKASGYTHGNLEGVLLRAIENEDDCDIYMAPYIDAGNQSNGSDDAYQTGDLVQIDGKDYIQVVNDGHLELTYTNGWTDNVEDEDNYSTCDDCGEREHNDNFYSTHHDSYVCEGCINENYYYAYVRNGQDYVHGDDVVSVGDEHYHVDYLDHYDIYYCEETEEYHHIDDLAMTSRGFIHVDWAKPIDHEDVENNNYAHRDDIHTLSDGTTCHADDKDALQAEIDREKSEDEPQPEPLAPVFEVLSNAIDANQPSRPNDTDGTTLQGQQQNENI